MESIEVIKKEIIKKLKPMDPDKIIIFGSYAWGTPSANSDIDIYVVTKDDSIPESWQEKNKIQLAIASAMQEFLQQYPTDLITHTRGMHKLFIESNSSIARKIMSEGIVIYE